MKSFRCFTFPHPGSRNCLVGGEIADSRWLKSRLHLPGNDPLPISWGDLSEGSAQFSMDLLGEVFSGAGHDALSDSVAATLHRPFLLAWVVGCNRSEFHFSETSLRPVINALLGSHHVALAVVIGQLLKHESDSKPTVPWRLIYREALFRMFGGNPQAVDHLLGQAAAFAQPSIRWGMAA